MQDATVNMKIPDYEYSSAKRAKQRVIEILGGFPSKNEKVQGIGITAHEGHAAIEILLRDDLPVPDPVLPQTVLGVRILFRKGPRQEAAKKEGYYRSNRQKMHSDIKEISTKLASKFGKQLDIGWPPSFKLSHEHTVIVETIMPEGQSDSYLIMVKVLKGVDTVPLYVADLTVDQFSKPEATSSFITRVQSGIASLKPALGLIEQ